MKRIVTIEPSLKVIKKLRLERDLTLEDVSSKSGLHVSFLRELEEKKQSPDFDIITILLHISEAFEMDFIELFKLVLEENEVLINQIKVEGEQRMDLRRARDRHRQLNDSKKSINSVHKG